MSERTVTSVLSDAVATLQTAELGLADLTGVDPRRRMSGLRNVAVFGRAVTNVLQNLRSVVGAQVFNEWYAPLQEKMREDELLRYFYKLRSEVLKEGTLETNTSTYIASLNSGDLRPITQNPPPGAKGFFVIDALGGSGWEVELPDGSVVKYYIALPDHVQNQITTHFYFKDAPRMHGGQTLQDTSVEELARLYIEYLRKLVTNAKSEFDI
jgi:hypothetical protein